MKNMLEIIRFVSSNSIGIERDKKNILDKFSMNFKIISQS